MRRLIFWTLFDAFILTTALVGFTRDKLTRPAWCPNGHGGLVREDGLVERVGVIVGRL